MNAHIITNSTVSVGTIPRTAALGLALTNQLLSAAGKPLLPIDNAQLEQMISTGLTVGAALAACWKNNSFTSAAIEADKFMHEQRIAEGEDDNGTSLLYNESVNCK